MKRGIGRGAGANRNGTAVFPPGTVSPVTRYRQPPPPPASGLGLLGRILLITFLTVTACGLGLGAGLYLYFHQTVAAVRAHTPAVKKAAAALDVPVANHAAIALVIGYDHRAGREASSTSLSDTLMLIRADPTTNSISLLSFPRDLDVPLYCGSSPSDTVGHVVTTDRINSAYARCGPKGTVLTVRHLTGLPINYLITVNFHGFKEVINKIGGIWMDIDRRYYNPPGRGFATINLQPGYQQLSGGAALDFVRFRHTDSDLYRLARQQEFVRAFREQVAKNLSFRKLPSLISTITNNIEVGEGGRSLQGEQVISYALFAQKLPGGRLFQDKIENISCALGCQASSSDIQAAVDKFQNPDVQSSKVANAAALGNKIKQTAPPPKSVTLTVLNGSGVAGAAANASYLLGQRGYQTLTPPNNLEPNAPVRASGQNYFHSMIYYDPAQRRSKAAAEALQNLMQPADVAKLPRRSQLLALDPGSMLLVVLGSAFHGTIAPPLHASVPVHVAAVVRADAGPGKELLAGVQKKVKFPLYVPTILDRYSYPDTASGDKAVRTYWLDGKHKHKAVRLVFRTGGNEYWGIQETDWDGAPALADKSFRHDLGGREFDLHYTGSKLHMVVLQQRGATYWVVNTLLDSLSNETMLAIAKGLKPLTSAR